MRYRYRAYYEYNGPTKGVPLRSQKSPEDIAYALERVRYELPHYLEDREARASAVTEDGRADSVIVTIETTDDAAAVSAAMIRCLDGLDLYGDDLGNA